MKTYSDIGQTNELKNLLLEISQYSLEDILPEEFIPASANSININELINILKIKVNSVKDRTYPTKKNLIIDVRSETEYNYACIPFSINLPILNDAERHNVGLIYTKHSESTGLSLACYYAKEKEKKYIEKVKNLIKENNPENIVVHCWRGGGRSRYAANLLRKYNIESFVLTGGFREFKKHVHDLLYNGIIRVISLSGQTGCGKSEILEYIKEKHPGTPVIHLEDCAGHASSVFGKIRYMNKDIAVNSQTQFEINLFREMLPYISEDKSFPVFLTENESRKIGDFFVPPSIMKGLEEENHIEIISPQDDRFRRLARDYFAADSYDQNLKSELKEKVLEQARHLVRKIGKNKISQYEKWIMGDEFYLFLDDIINSYYDKIYKKPVKEPLLAIENRDIKTAAGIILKFLDSYLENL